MRRLLAKLLARKEHDGRAGPGRAAQLEKFPVVDERLARPSASLVTNIPLHYGPGQHASVVKQMSLHSLWSSDS